MRFTFPIPPVPRQRPDKFGRTPPKTRDYEQIVGQMVQEQMQDVVGREVLDERLIIDIEIYDDGSLVTIEPTHQDKPNKTRGDLDNYAKALLDAMQGYVFKNDSQIDGLVIIRKRGLVNEQTAQRDTN